MQTPLYRDLYNKAVMKVKKRVARWPSAYASGQVVIEYKKMVSMLHGPKAKAYANPNHMISKPPLTRWFDERWIDILTKRPCGSARTSRYYPVCRPEKIARRLSSSQILDAVGRKQRAGRRTASYPAYFRGKQV